MVRKPWDDRPGLLLVQPMGEQEMDLASKLAQLYFDFFNNIWGTSASLILEEFYEECLLRTIFGKAGPAFHGLPMFVNGFNLRFQLPPQASVLLARRTDGSLGLVSTRLLAAASVAEAESVARKHLSAGNGVAKPAGDVLFLMTSKTITDFRTGLIIPDKPGKEEFRALMLSALPLPPEVTI
jgi:hypothetical protein